jgi:hypothetical protein
MKKNTKSHLIIDRADFSQKINSQITIGNELLSRRIASHEAFETVRSDISKWSNYNMELLKQSFDNIDNEYLNEYKSIRFCDAFAGAHYLTEEARRYKKRVSKYILGLEKIVNKIDLIPTKGIA